MRTLKLIALLGFQYAADAMNLMAATLAMQELEHQARLKEQRRLARPKKSGLPEYAQEMFMPQGGELKRES